MRVTEADILDAIRGALSGKLASDGVCADDECGDEDAPAWDPEAGASAPEANRHASQTGGQPAETGHRPTSAPFHRSSLPDCPTPWHAFSSPTTTAASRW